MRNICTLLITFLFFSVSYSQGWHNSNSESPLIRCGDKKIDCLLNQGNDFNYKDYKGCLPENDEYRYDGDDVSYELFFAELSEIRIKLISRYEKGFFLLKETPDGKECVAAGSLTPDEEGTRTGAFLGPLKLYPGKYFVVVDERSYQGYGNFELELECGNVTPPSICELGGPLIKCKNTISGTLPEQSVDTPIGMPPAIVNQFPSCIPPQSFTVYLAYFDQPGTINAFLTNATEGTRVFIYSEYCACLSDIECFEDSDCSSREYGEGTIVNAREGFYFIVVTGSAGGTFDLTVISDDCRCSYETTPIECGEEVKFNLVPIKNKFDNLPGYASNAYENCYGGERPYIGGDEVLEFRTSTFKKITIKLSSYWQAGIFLFDADCTNNCLAFGETFGLNGEAYIRDFVISPGVYQIFVDLAYKRAIDDWTKVLLTCEDIPDPVYIANSINSDKIHRIRILTSTFFGNSSVPIDENADTYELAFFHRDMDCDFDPNNSSEILTGSISNTIDVFGMTKNSPRGYVEGEKFNLIFRQDKETVPVDGIFEDEKNTFKDKSRSKLQSIAPKIGERSFEPFFSVEDQGQELNSKGGSEEIIININPNEAWCIDVNDNSDGLIDVGSISKKKGTGYAKISFKYFSNNTDKRMQDTLTVKAGGLNRLIDVAFFSKPLGPNNMNDDEDESNVGGRAGARGNNNGSNSGIFSGNSLNISPNPHTGGFRVILNPFDEKEHTLTIYDTFGKIIKQFNWDTVLKNQVEFIDINNFNSGIYYLELRSGNQLFVEKMIKI